MHIDLHDQVALVTGSARRVGKAIAMELARCGINIMVHYGHSPEKEVREAVHEMKSLGANAFSVQADLATPEGVEAIFTAVHERFGKLDILVNSASTFIKRDLKEVTPEEWQRTLDVNLTAPFLCTRAAAELMAKNDPPGGVIINILDKGAVRPWPEYAHHGISKAALLALTRASAVSYGPHIRVNGIIPGPILPPAGEGMTEGKWAEQGEKTPLKRTGAPDDVGRAVVYLASESFVTGTVIHVNAGEHLI